jgi:hypothetical protein
MSNIQTFSNIWTLIPHTYNLAKTVMGGVQISLFVASPLNDKQQLARNVRDARLFHNAAKELALKLARWDPIHGGAIKALIAANEEALTVYDLLEERVI